jgi:DNA-binding response OmpR family regulator
MTQSQIKKVLIVDDEEDLTWSISKNLSRDKEKFDIICVNSGREALQVLAQTDVDLVVSDIRMPEISGLELLLEIKEKYSHIKVIIMTAYGTPDYEKVAFERGCIYYLEKPFEISHLRDVIIDSLTEKKGFVGQVSDFELSDIIQMNCLGRITTALYVEQNNQSGVIFFRDGNIVHAENATSKGEDAFYDILSWDGGRFSSKRGLETTEESIFKGWQSLLLEGMKRADEGQAQSDGKLQHHELFERELQTLSTLEGVLFTGILDDQLKMRLQKSVPSYSTDEELDAISTTMNKVKSNLIRLSNTDDASDLESLVLKFKDLYVHFVFIPAVSVYLLIIANGKLNTGKLTIQLKKSIKEFEHSSK